MSSVFQRLLEVRAERSSCTTWSFTWTVPSSVIVTFTALGGVLVCCASGRSTFFPVFAMTEDVTMKMMRRTRKTSVSGVMLISAMISPSVSVVAGEKRPSRTSAGPCPPSPLRLDVEQRLHEALGRAREDLAINVTRVCSQLKSSEREDRDEEADRGRDQRLGDAARHDVEAGVARDPDLVERAHDADHRAEEADVGRERADRADEPEPAPELRDRLGWRPC